MEQPKFIHLLYVPTMACNMCCKYCYLEENRKRLIKNHSHRLFLNMIAMDTIGMGIMRLAETDKVNIIVIIM